jgi:hypothetical protein
VHREKQEFSVFSRRILSEKHDGKDNRFECLQNCIKGLNPCPASGGALTENVFYDITAGHEEIALERSHLPAGREREGQECLVSC